MCTSHEIPSEGIVERTFYAPSQTMQSTRQHITQPTMLQASINSRPGSRDAVRGFTNGVQSSLEKTPTLDTGQGSADSQLLDLTPPRTAVILPKQSNTKQDLKYLVTFDGPNDCLDPLNWSLQRKLVNTMLCGLTTMGTTWASSM